MPDETFSGHSHVNTHRQPSLKCTQVFLSLISVEAQKMFQRSSGERSSLSSVQAGLWECVDGVGEGQTKNPSAALEKSGLKCKQLERGRVLAFF